MKKVFRIIGLILLFILLMSGGITLSLRIPAVQNYIAHLAVNYVSNKLGTKVEIKSFEWSLFRNIDLKGFYMADKNGDTLIYAGTINADVSYWGLIKKDIKIKSISIEDAKVHLLNDTAGHLNLTELFQDPSAGKVKSPGDTVSSPTTMLINIGKVGFYNTDFRFEDQKKHLLVTVLMPACDIDINNLALQKKLIDIHTVTIDGVKAAVTVEAKDENTPPPPSELFRFLPPGWEIRWDGISLSNSSFAYNDINKAIKDKGTDFAHIVLSGIDLKARKGVIHRDSIDLDIKSLAAKEKSGFEIKKLAGLAKVSINEISLRNLSLETGNSRINTYLALTYSDFEDFNDFTNKVTIKADMNDAAVSLKDLNYLFNGLGPVAHNTLTISGKIRGKINELQGRDIVIRTAMGTYLKCNFYTNGLPNINETSLNLKIDQFVTTAQDIKLIYPTSLYKEY